MSFVLDTNVLVHILRDSNKGKQIIQDYFHEEAPTLLISIVTQGEIEVIAMRNGWGDKKIKSLRKLLDQFLIIPINTVDLVNRYAEIDAYSQGHLKENPLPKGMSARNMGKNDVWIAATASITRTTLLTMDGDFDHLVGSGYCRVINV